MAAPATSLGAKPEELDGSVVVAMMIWAVGDMSAVVLLAADVVVLIHELRSTNALAAGKNAAPVYILPTTPPVVKLLSQHDTPVVPQQNRSVGNPDSHGISF
ncbi:hypothetical protein BP6252_13794 [Coleophoma cylindrospora]|uniref:Uncharacterized protein n=1 Tax=Coleophoma cylindrospora TaxID=1849047 RepID=A0A3D8Q6J6_9HELO|nr:hypothetical protein BP6252_13794 [Coleophoma cylindrospora]